jgi:Xaa-Pro dipeptidase
MRPGELFGLAFPREEYHRRLAELRKQMKSREVEVLLLFSPVSINYISGNNTVGLLNRQCLLVPMDRNPILVVRVLEQPVALATTWLEDIFTYEDHESPDVAIKRALHEAGLSARCVAAEQTGLGISFQSYRHLETVLEMPLPDGSGLVEAVQVIKSPIELEYIRVAARISEIGMQAAYDGIAEGKTENEVVAEAYSSMLVAGSEFFNFQPALTSGEQAGIAHTTFHRRLLKMGDAVMIELSGVWNRYSAPLFRTAVVGVASMELQRMYDVCVAALEATLEVIRPGVRSMEVQAAAQAVINQHGYEPNFRKRVGYTFGVGFPPDWNGGHIMDIKQNDNRELVSGMVFHITPALRQRQEFGVACSETVAVTDSGVEVITDFSRHLFISK